VEIDCIGGTEDGRCIRVDELRDEIVFKIIGDIDMVYLDRKGGFLPIEPIGRERYYLRRLGCDFTGEELNVYVHESLKGLSKKGMVEELSERNVEFLYRKLSGRQWMGGSMGVRKMLAYVLGGCK